MRGFPALLDTVLAALIGARAELLRIGSTADGAFVAIEINRARVRSIVAGEIVVDWMQFVDPQVGGHPVDNHRSKVSSGLPVICDAVEVKTGNGFALRRVGESEADHGSRPGRKSEPNFIIDDLAERLAVTLRGCNGPKDDIGETAVHFDCAHDLLSISVMPG